ncbi:Rha family transcriptional regulator [Kaistia sp. UC242_56]|uniref:Rha family transcriptional regulator n=1 Tax=Kaistia sp. UC242_56 TaxID=3374625 RepID=UPI0037A7E9F5
MAKRQKLPSDPWPRFGSAEFSANLYVHPQNGQTYRSANMTRNGFTMLVMGFTGARARQFKQAYIDAFTAWRPCSGRASRSSARRATSRTRVREDDEPCNVSTRG